MPGSKTSSDSESLNFENDNTEVELSWYQHVKYRGFKYYAKKFLNGVLSLLPGKRALIVALIMLGLAASSLIWPAVMFEAVFFTISSISGLILWSTALLGGGAAAEFASVCAFAFLSPLVLVTAFNLCEAVVVGLYQGVSATCSWIVSGIKKCCCCGEKEDPLQLNEPTEILKIRTPVKGRGPEVEEEESKRDYRGNGSQFTALHRSNLLNQDGSETHVATSTIGINSNPGSSLADYPQISPNPNSGSNWKGWFSRSTDTSISTHAAIEAATTSDTVVDWDVANRSRTFRQPRPVEEAIVPSATSSTLTTGVKVS